MKNIIWIYEQFRPLLYMWFFFYYCPYLIRKGWGDAENKTKKVCDICFRDIKAWNEKIAKEKSKLLVKGK